VAADYSQIELRVLAHYTADERLCEAFQHDEDIHARVPAGQQRAVGAGHRGHAPAGKSRELRHDLRAGSGRPFPAIGIDRETAAKFINSYFQTFPGIERFLIESLAECRKQAT